MGKQYIRATYNEKGQKLCSNCKNFKDFSEFHKRKASPDGIVTYCKDCVRDIDLKRNEGKLLKPKKVIGDLVHCRKCERYLDQSNFWGQKTYCKECSKLIGHSANLKRFGLTPDDYIDMEKAHNGVCAICKNPETKKRRLSIDHDHSCCDGPKSCSNCIRGLLCFRCNAVLGQINDDIEILKSMIEYLQK